MFAVTFTTVIIRLIVVLSVALHPRNSTKVEGDKADSIERSRLTNSLHQQLYSLLEQVSSVAARGVEDNLDPGCLAIFKKVCLDARVIKQMVKAEIQAHMGKGKWG